MVTARLARRRRRRETGCAGRARKTDFCEERVRISSTRLGLRGALRDRQIIGIGHSGEVSVRVGVYGDSVGALVIAAAEEGREQQFSARRIEHRDDRVEAASSVSLDGVRRYRILIGI